jgi:hypothetical protein
MSLLCRVLGSRLQRVAYTKACRASGRFNPLLAGSRADSHAKRVTGLFTCAARSNTEPAAQGARRLLSTQASGTEKTSKQSVEGKNNSTIHSSPGASITHIGRDKWMIKIGAATVVAVAAATWYCVEKSDHELCAKVRDSMRLKKK